MTTARIVALVKQQIKRHRHLNRLCGFDFEYFCEANNPNKHCMESERAAVQVLHMRHYGDGSCWSFLIQQILYAGLYGLAKNRIIVHQGLPASIYLY